MNPHAVKVMAEAGVDLSKHYSKTLADLNGVAFDYVVTVCGHANDAARFSLARPRSSTRASKTRPA